MSRITSLISVAALSITLALPLPASTAELCRFVFDGRPRSEFQLPAPLVVDAKAEGLRFDGLRYAKAWGELMKLKSATFDVTIEALPFPKIVMKPRTRATKPFRVLITAGVHGNEPLGVQTAIDVVHHLARTGTAVPSEIVILPTVNLEGLLIGKRTTRTGEDLNRLFEEDSHPVLMRIKKEIGNEPFDLSLDLHGANSRSGFFVIRSGPDRDVARKALDHIDPSLRLLSDLGTPVGPVSLRTKAGTRVGYHLLAAGLAQSNNSGTLKGYMTSIGTPLSYTVEYPGRLPLETVRRTNLELVLAMMDEAALGAR